MGMIYRPYNRNILFNFERKRYLSMKKLIGVIGVVTAIMALIGSFLAGCMFIFNAAVETGNVQVEAKGPDELVVKTRRRKYTETKLPEQRHYGF